MGCPFFVAISQSFSHRQPSCQSLDLSVPKNGKQTVSVFMAKGNEARLAEGSGTLLIDGAHVSFGPATNIVESGAYKFFAGARSDAFFFDYEGIKNLFDTTGGRN